MRRMMFRMLQRRSLFLALVVVLTACVLVPAAAQPAQSARCPSGTVRAVIAGNKVCLKAGQRCTKSLDRQYHRYGFHCHTGRLQRIKPPVARPRFVAIQAAGPPQTVFSWTNDRCEDLDIPDLPARAFRDAQGRAQLISPHFINRRFIGPDLDHLTHDCSPILHSGFNADPSAFDDHEWISLALHT